MKRLSPRADAKETITRCRRTVCTHSGLDIDAHKRNENNSRWPLCCSSHPRARLQPYPHLRRLLLEARTPQYRHLMFLLTPLHPSYRPLGAIGSRLRLSHNQTNDDFITIAQSVSSLAGAVRNSQIAGRAQVSRIGLCRYFNVSTSLMLPNRGLASFRHSFVMPIGVPHATCGKSKAIRRQGVSRI